MKQPEIDTFRPRMRVLNEKQAWAIHHAALEILERTGFSMEHPEVRRMLLDAGCQDDSEDRLLMPARLVEKALKTAPRQITLYDQLGQRTMPLVDGNFYYGTGSDTIFTIDLESGERRRTVLQDTANFAHLVDGLDNMDFSMSMGNPTDAPIEEIYVHVFAEMVKNSNKPICFIADSGKDIAKIHEIACLVAGGEDALARRPFILNYSEAISPLRFPTNVMEKLVFCARKQIPICLPSGCNAGGGGPTTLAGAMALGIAENMVGLVIHQLTNEGAPFLFAPNVSVLDMRHTVISYGCTEWSLTQAALADMRDMIYHLPIWAFAGATDAKTVDAQAGAEGMLSIVTAMLSRCNFIHDVGYIESGNTSSLEMLTLADELVGMSRYFVDGLRIDDDTLALDVIDRVARNGESGAIFISDSHTFKHFKTALFHPELGDRSRFEHWEANGSKDMQQRCNQKTRNILADHPVTPKPEAVLEGISTILGRNEISEDMSGSNETRLAG
ncbi:trimethylamine methyltransferase MttB [Desulfosarcina widdelii]|uniref:Trimethylamine methyltransferase MttB n=1 Tax=Desulfosarcina widdelii TaxID=947919 RepID=A0A5K7ZDF6_9BACT|nr:trimethylamine methyltransferase family protein [Desulfosarcina widdelii]BBO78805.1 trimethylamine methyltransferase MttB [Desulfosarcina widdelii]